jgi:hypothetical protein
MIPVRGYLASELRHRMIEDLVGDWPPGRLLHLCDLQIVPLFPAFQQVEAVRIAVICGFHQNFAMHVHAKNQKDLRAFYPEQTLRRILDQDDGSVDHSEPLPWARKQTATANPFAAEVDFQEKTLRFVCVASMTDEQSVLNC